MTVPLWVALVAVVVAVLSLGLCVVFWQRRLFDAVRLSEVRSEPAWPRRAIVTELPTDAHVLAFAEMIEGQLHSPRVHLTIDLTPDAALKLLAQLRRECPPPREAE